jgi:hypothetical protein
MRQACRVAPAAEGVAEARRRERPAVCRRQKSEILRRRRIDDRGQIKMHRNVEVDWTAVLVLGLAIPKTSVAGVLGAEPDDVFATASRVEQDSHRKPRRSANWVLLLEFLNLLERPAVEALRHVPDRLHAGRGVVRCRGIGPAFAFTWPWKSPPRGGRPQIEADLRALIRRMSIENPLWGAPRIHGELLKLGFEIAQSSVDAVEIFRREILTSIFRMVRRRS